MTKSKPCRLCFEDGILRPCFLWQIGMCSPLEGIDESYWLNKENK